ncbi:phytoene desaturase family protein [Silvibacterium dinghuense]|uniref:NAD(P)/FAD-dependent oxidoreductase n=1 Tax=Silvibacterium dinghuense TaxID=1560006 RepID=A0A4Q1SL51_9BACT|nr:NAD(P)/FAD-dependent oxidoreductase [Silvibacterium dinghuense]RXS98020.1 NAD(P)/FAD-dependent oxidoreductase [Silvibacterium dinghuense]GGH03882.1 FAD-dependent oxidoreductase [Silvibacterium dinghuense]
MSLSPTARVLGRIGLPAPVHELAAQRWDAIIVGAGHNGLACAAYLARAGKRVLVLESRERVGGACTIEETFPGVRMSPCAYLAGLLHPLIVEELNLAARGFRWFPAVNGLFVPFLDGSSIQLWDDDQLCEEEIRAFAPHDLEGFRAMSDVIRRLRDALRPAVYEGSSKHGFGNHPGRDFWQGSAPTPEEIDHRLGNDLEARKVLYEWSMAEFVGAYLDDERLQSAYLGQGVIGTNASPFDPGTASIRFHHASGRLGGMPGMWGYVQGGMGMVSFYLCDAAREAGAVVAAGVPVAQIHPGAGVELEGGDRLLAPVVISNADPVRTLRMLGSAADPAWRAQVERVPIEGCTVKLNVLLRELPDFTARPGQLRPHHYGQINAPLTHEEWKAAFAASRRGELPEHLWCEIYFQSVHDPAVVPAGRHTMSIFAQYVPYRFAQGSWDTRRDEVRRLALKSLGRFCSNLDAAVIDAQVLGPPDIEEKVGLTGGHIFQGECLPPYMWSKRLAARTPMLGMYLCGAATHPGGSVIGINGRNAAMAVLADME